MTLLLHGAIDAQARAVRQIYEVSLKPSKRKLQKRRPSGKGFAPKGRADSATWLKLVVSRISCVALSTIRNRIHEDPLGELGYSSPATGDVGLLTLGGDDAQKILKSLRSLGDPAAMGVFPFDHPRILIEPFRCASFLVRHALSFIGAVAQATEFGLTPADEPEHPGAGDLFRPRTLNNMKLFFRSVAEL